MAAYYNGYPVTLYYTGSVNLETLQNKFANAVVREKSENNAVRIDNLSPTATKIDASINFIDQEKFMSTNVGNAYLLELNESNYNFQYEFNATIKDVDLTGVNVSLYTEVLGSGVSGLVQEYKEYHIISDGIPQTTISFKITDVGQLVLSKIHIFVVDPNADNNISTSIKLSDIFESVSIVPTDAKIMSYGKKLFDDRFIKGLSGSTATNGRRIYLGAFFAPVTISFTVDSTKNIGSLNLRRIIKYSDKPENDTTDTTIQIVSSGKLKTITIDGVTNKFGDYYFGYGSNLDEGAITSLQVEAGITATAHEDYIEPLEGAHCISPTTTIVVEIPKSTDRELSKNPGTKITATYNMDTDAAINAAIKELENKIITLGGEI